MYENDACGEDQSAGSCPRPVGVSQTVVQELRVIALPDHLVVFAFAIVLPVYARYNYPRFKRAVESGVAEARSRQYRKTTVRQWSLALVAIAVWFHAGRSAEELGLGAPSGPRFWIGLVVAAALAILWRRMFLAAVDDEAGRERLMSQLNAVRPLLPSSVAELRDFTVLSITAGICEELLFRGYLIWYLAGYVGLPTASVLSGVAFGLGHLYQGRRQAVKIIFVGFVFVLFYIGTGTLWIPMTLHALLDAAQGRLAYRLLKNEA